MVFKRFERSQSNLQLGRVEPFAKATTLRSILTINALKGRRVSSVGSVREYPKFSNKDHRHRTNPAPEFSVL